MRAWDEACARQAYARREHYAASQARAQAAAAVARPEHRALQGVGRLERRPPFSLDSRGTVWSLSPSGVLPCPDAFLLADDLLPAASVVTSTD